MDCLPRHIYSSSFKQIRQSNAKYYHNGKNNKFSSYDKRGKTKSLKIARAKKKNKKKNKK